VLGSSIALPLRSSSSSSKGSSIYSDAPPQPKWPGGATPTNGRVLQQLQEACNARSRWFLERKFSNRSEAAAVAMLLRKAPREMQERGFRHLIGYEWCTKMSWRIGDMLFTDGNGRLLVVEAKGAGGSLKVAQYQAEALARVLRVKYPGCGVFAAVWSPFGGGAPWEWMPGHKPPEALTSSSSSSSRPSPVAKVIRSSRLARSQQAKQLS
jgi:hypothetical protein